MGGSRRLAVLTIVTSAALLSAGASAQAAASSAASSISQAAVTAGHPDPAVAPPPGTGAQAAAVAAASKRAEASGKAVPITSMTTATSQTSADPHGGFTVTEYTYPVRVRRGGSWVPVNTMLAHGGDGSLSATAVPDDTVTFSGGGPGRLATISAAGTSLSLSWPGTLPAPVVSGASATYPNMLRGVDLVLTATSAQSGGFSEVLVVHSAAAAANPALARLRLGVAGHGVRLASYGGELVASGQGVPGYYAAAAPVEWDSSSFASGVSLPGRSAMASMKSAARSAGATLTQPGTGPATSSAAGPASGARVAPVKASVVGGTSLSLVPDRVLLTSPTTKFPVFIDPSFTWHPADSKNPHRDEVQSACPTASHFDAPDGASDTYNSLGVGFDDWPPGDCNGNAGTAYAYYQLNVPSSIYGGHLFTATVNAQVAYTASCASTDAQVTLSETYAMNSGTDWNNKPGVIASLATVGVGPNPNSCNNTFDTDPTSWTAAGFNVLSALQKIASTDGKTFTFRLWQQGSPSDTVWRRFGPAPYLQIQYNQTPDAPKALAISSGTTTNADCLTSPYPWVGQLATSGTGTVMSANVKDKDGDQLAAKFKYWVNGSSTTTTVDSTSSSIRSGTNATADIPPSFTNGLQDGTEVDWQAYAYDGAPAAQSPTGGWSPECHFFVFPTAAAAPAVTGGPAIGSVPGTQATFTVAAASVAGLTPKSVVWGLDKQPSLSSPPAAQTVSLPSGATTANVTVTIPSGGPHAFYSYVAYTSGPPSALATDTFSTSNDPNVSCASFADALNNSCTGPSAPNTMISNGSGNTAGTANGDGARTALSEADLTAAGWGPGTSVTVDGATFTLPDFGTSASGADNVLSANQTIGLPADSQGSSLVFLALATNADAAAPDAADLPASQPASSNLAEMTTPAVTAGTGIAGQNCTLFQDSQQDASGNPVCVSTPAGAINYASGSGASPEAYYLTVPDWSDTTAQRMDAVTLPHVAGSTGLSSRTVGIYAFSVPLNPGAAVTSVTLPDLGAATAAAPGVPWPALHIFGIAVANTTSATPGSTAAQAAGPWTGAWSAPIESSFAPHAGTSYGNQTIRITTQASAGGSALRLRLSDSLAAPGTAALSVGAVTVAAQSSGAAVSGAPVAVTFGGAGSVTIPAGSDVYSDPVGFAVAPGEYLTISIYLTGTASYPSLPGQNWCDACTEYVSASGSGNQSGNTDGTPFSGSGTATGDFSTVLTGVDVIDGGLPTVVVLGDQVTDGGSTGTPVHGAPRLSDDLASALQLQPGGPAFGVVNAGINSNQILADADTGTGASGGPSAVSRLARDVLAEPGVGTVVVAEGTKDLLHGATEQALNGPDGIGGLVSQLQAWGITVIVGTVPACYGYTPSADPCTTTVDSTRTALNTDLLGAYSSPTAGCSINTIPPVIPPCEFAAGFSGAVGNTASPQQLITAANAGDHVNLTAAGYLAEAGTIPVIAGQPVPLAADVPPDY